ncbi:hypothetical protein FGRMN_8164 [Fusarium graminum]|nr:hypothetical protein FGRMN_8164 [Fusarium graminum]
MATGLEVLSVVSAVCQLICFAGESISLCRKIYNGISTSDDDLKSHAQRMSDALGRVQARNINTGSQPSGYDAEFKGIVEGCKAAAISLEEELKLVAGMDIKKRFFEALIATLRASSRRKKLDRLEASLSKYQHLIETEMLSRLCSRSDAIQIQQKQGFQDLEKDTQNLILQIAQGHTKLEDLIRATHAETREAISQSLGATKAHITTEIRTLETSGRTETQRQVFLQSLRFPDINQRYNGLMSSRDATFQRIFSSYNSIRVGHSSSPIMNGTTTCEACEDDYTHAINHMNKVCQSWTPFTDWLESNEPIFCIRGKPGSGKSALVKFVIDNGTTKQLLERWSPGCVIVSHFFWKIGSEHQNTIKGLFCSLLYKMTEGNGVTIDRTLCQYPHLLSKTSYSDWSTKELETVLDFAMKVDLRPRCIFIDGLDEVCNKDGLDKATEAIEKILKYPRSKICISTRPETIVMRWVTSKHVPSLLLEDLTSPDMQAFVFKELHSFKSNGTLTEGTYNLLQSILICKAEGVFLWLHLATRNVKTGILHQDSEETLLSRLQQLPNELEKLYADMWGRMNETCAESAHAQDILLSSSPAMSAAKLKDLCERSKLDIENRCAGLLVWNRPDGRDICHCAEDGTVTYRSLNDGQDIYDALLGRAEFIHRTAHDYLVDTESGQAIISYGHLSKHEVGIRKLKGLLCLIQVLYSELHIQGIITCTLLRMVSLLGVYARECVPDVMDLVPALQNLYERVERSWWPGATFLSYLARHGSMDDYVKVNIANERSPLLATRVLRDVWVPKIDLTTRYWFRWAPSSTLVDALICMGADPHAYGLTGGFDFITRYMEPLVREGTPFTNLLTYANFAMAFDGYRGSEAARETLKVAIKLATTCPDLNATTLVLASFDDRGYLLRYLATLSSRRPAHHEFLLLCEASLKFLLSNLIFGLGVDLDEYTLGNVPSDRILELIKEPSFEIRVVYNENVCVVGPQLPFHSVPIDLILNPATSVEQNQIHLRLYEAMAAFQYDQSLTSTHDVEKVGYESAILSFSGKGLGFSTMLEAGITPPLRYLRERKQNMKRFPVTYSKLEALAKEQEAGHSRDGQEN